jgi:hypothetical protein
MAQHPTLRVSGYRELMRAYQQADKDSRKELRVALKHVGEVVQRDAVRHISPINARTAAGYKIRVRQRGVAVEQSIRKTTGAHPEWGSYQMRHALLPALMANADEVERRVERALDVVANQFNHGGPF